MVKVSWLEKQGVTIPRNLAFPEPGMEELAVKIVDRVTAEASGSWKVGLPVPAVLGRAFGVSSGEGARVGRLEACIALIGAIHRQKLNKRMYLVIDELTKNDTCDGNRRPQCNLNSTE